MQKKPAQILLAILLFAAIILAACGTQEAEDAPLSLSAILKDLTGKVSIKDAGEKDFSEAGSGATLHQDGQLQTGEDGRVRLDLSTGTIIRLSPSTLFQLTSNQESDESLVTRLKLETGRLFIILNGGSMEVDTPSGVASVRGSFMMVEVLPGTLDVLITCLEGNCEANNPAGGLEFVGGQKTILFHRKANGQYTPPGMEWMTEADFQLWLDENPEAADLFNQAMATLTAMAPTEEPTAEPSEEPTSEPTTEPTDASGNIVPPGGDSCIKLVYPSGGSTQLESGSILFEWESSVNAVKYVLTITYPNGSVVQFETTETTLTRFLESMPAGGSYTWTISAIGSDGKEICSSEPGGFSKPEGATWEDKQKNNKPSCDNVCDPSIPECYQPSQCWTLPPTETPYDPYCDPWSSYYDPCNPLSTCQDLCTTPTVVPTCDPCDWYGSCYDPCTDSTLSCYNPQDPLCYPTVVPTCSVPSCNPSDPCYDPMQCFGKP